MTSTKVDENCLVERLDKVIQDIYPQVVVQFASGISDTSMRKILSKYKATNFPSIIRALISWHDGYDFKKIRGPILPLYKKYYLLDMNYLCAVLFGQVKASSSRNQEMTELLSMPWYPFMFDGVADFIVACQGETGQCRIGRVNLSDYQGVQEIFDNSQEFMLDLIQFVGEGPR